MLSCKIAVPRSSWDFATLCYLARVNDVTWKCSATLNIGAMAARSIMHLLAWRMCDWHDSLPHVAVALQKLILAELSPSTTGI